MVFIPVRRRKSGDLKWDERKVGIHKTNTQRRTARKGQRRKQPIFVGRDIRSHDTKSRPAKTREDIDCIFLRTKESAVERVSEGRDLVAVIEPDRS